ncbi:phytanoyl-CoA dioxygenase domain-containing protein 1 [Diplogelasinospora grovesii]|uniref:Phytanoyl-CoA dioxygenase domain-containing protein 1 n=1 Tax=Diplogelasinospora grovesii TaxID=303347 RepID=A0AAN6NI33_9PEZI|nr:phytanoyl-CoA dioxygenase domain-containing protein 1 [Diplogelasinospora grovesii]
MAGNYSNGGGGLTEDQLASFHKHGYLIVPDALSPAVVASLLSTTHDLLLSGFSLADHPMTRFRTDERQHVGDRYFLESGDKIRFFFEEDAFDATGRLTKPKERAINKIGHCLHGLSPPFASLLASGSTEGVRVHPAAVARQLGFRDARCLQSMVICKQPEIGGAVPPHQDSTFLYTDPPSAVGFWYALEDATLGNGCLSFLPGSHRWAPIEKRLVRKEDSEGGGTQMVANEGAKFPPGEEYGKGGCEERGEEGYVPGEVRAGSLVLIHGNLLHKSEKNTSQKGRIIYTFHIIEQGDDEGRRVYDERNWLQPPAEGFTRLY